MTWSPQSMPKPTRWEWDFCSWHTTGWWEQHWAKTGKVSIDHADAIKDGWRDWLRFNDFVAPAMQDWWIAEVARTHDMLEADRGENLEFTRIVATKR